MNRKTHTVSIGADATPSIWAGIAAGTAADGSAGEETRDSHGRVVRVHRCGSYSCIGGEIVMNLYKRFPYGWWAQQVWNWHTWLMVARRANPVPYVQGRDNA